MQRAWQLEESPAVPCSKPQPLCWTKQQRTCLLGVMRTEVLQLFKCYMFCQAQGTKASSAHSLHWPISSILKQSTPGRQQAASGLSRPRPFQGLLCPTSTEACLDDQKEKGHHNCVWCSNNGVLTVHGRPLNM